jgi:hypothetical protein
VFAFSDCLSVVKGCRLTGPCSGKGARRSAFSSCNLLQSLVYSGEWFAPHSAEG